MNPIISLTMAFLLLVQGVVPIGVSASAASSSDRERYLEHLKTVQAQKTVSRPKSSGGGGGGSSSSEMQDQEKEQEQEKDEITNVFFNVDFEKEEALDDFVLTLKENSISRGVDLRTDNHYLFINKTKDTDCMVQIPVTNEKNQHVVIEADFSTKNGVPGGRLFIGRDATTTSMLNYYLNVDSSGNITLPNGTILGKIRVGKWTHVAIAIDFGTRTYDIYINNNLAKKAQPLANQTTNTIQHLRIQLNSKLTGDLMVDNLKAYESTKPGEVSLVPAKRSILLSKTAVMNTLGDVKVVESYTGKMYVNREKQSTVQPVIREDDQTYLSLQDMQALFGGNARFTNESTTHPGYYPLCSNAEALGFETVNYYDNGLTMISDAPISFTESWQNEIFNFMLFDRPTAEEIQTLYSQHVAGQHPRVILTPERVTSIKALCETDANMIQWKANVLAAANKAFTTPVAGYTMSSTGSINDVDTALPLMMNLGMAYQLTGSKRYAGRAWIELQKIFSLTDWNLASYLDVGELTAITGIAYDWMYDAFSPEQRAYIEENIFNFGVNNTYKLYYNQLKNAYTTWYDSVGNWNAVCNGGSMLGAIALFDRYPEECSSLIANASQALQFMMVSYYPDGAWLEGTGYWNYALQYMALTVESFLQAFGTDFGYLSFPGFSNTGWYGLMLSGSTGGNGFGDAGSAFVDSHSVMWCANRFQSADLMNARLMEMEKNHWDGGIYELLYYNPDLVGENYQLDLDTGMRGIEAVSLREAWYESGATFLGFHGGAAKRNHGHLDIGSYVLDMVGERFVMDPGAENYNASGYFSTKRYLYYRTRPEGHNMYVINPTDAEDDYGIDITSKATYDSIRSKPQGAYSIMDLTEAYNRDVTSAKRGYMLADSRRSAIVRDEITLKGESEVYWFVHTKADIEVVDNQTVYLTLNGKRVKMMVLTNAEDYTLEEMSAAPLPTSPTISQIDNSTTGIHKVALKAKTSGQLNITVKFIPADDIAADDRPTDTPLANWHIPDGEAVVLPTVDMIYADGEPLDAFEAKTTGYAFLTENFHKTVPRITASAEGRVVTVTQAENFGEDTVVRVTDPNNAELYREYRVNYYKLPPLEDVNGQRRYPVFDITASAVPQEENGKTNIIDQSFASRWAAEGDGQWITLELEEVFKIDTIGISFMNGNSRTTKFTLEISEDGTNWTKIYSGDSTGETSEYEFYDAGGRMAKFVRFTGYGNSKNAWNSVTELAALGNR